MKHLPVLMLSVVLSASFAPRAFAAERSIRPGIYSAPKALEFSPDAWVMNGETIPNSNGLVMSAESGESFHATELNEKQILVTVARSPEEIQSGEVPEKMILSRAEFERAGLRFALNEEVDVITEFESGLGEGKLSLFEDAAQVRRSTHRFRVGNATAGFTRDRNGRIAGYGGNCVRVVLFLTGERVHGNGKDIVGSLLRTGRWVPSGPSGKGTVCSWSGGPGGYGHVGYNDGSCFQPTYQNNCGQPGRAFRLTGCARRR